MGDFHFYYYIFLFCKISTVYMLLNHQEKSVVENWSKSLLDLIYQCFNLPHFYNSCFAFFKLLISHGRNKRHQLPFPSLISLAFQVTHPWCSTAGGILRGKHIIYRSGNWGPDSFSLDAMLSVLSCSRWSSWHSTLYLVPCCIPEDTPQKEDFYIHLRFWLGFLLNRQLIISPAVILVFHQSPSKHKTPLLPYFTAVCNNMLQINCLHSLSPVPLLPPS